METFRGMKIRTPPIVLVDNSELALVAMQNPVTDFVEMFSTAANMASINAAVLIFASEQDIHPRNVRYTVKWPESMQPVPIKRAANG